MKMIFEENIENEDFLELILDEDESEILCEYGIVKDFPVGLRGLRNLNVFIRIAKGENYAISERKRSENKERVFREY